MFKKKTTTDTAKSTQPAMSKGEWMQKYWRPCAAFMYMACCLCDFAIFPIMFTVVQFWEEQAANDAFRQWIPITLQGGGLFHVSMCAVLGVSAYGRTQEKLAGQSAGGQNATPTINQPTTFGVSTPTGGFGNNTTNPPVSPAGFGSAPAATSSSSTSSFGSSFGPAQAEVVAGFGGKPAPVIPPFPEK